MSEIWKDIDGYDGAYQISSHGRVFSVSSKIYRKLGEIPGKRSKPRLNVTISYKGKHCNHSVHRLVAIAFLPNPENKATVNHKDGNPKNNLLDNLEWATQSENNIHSHRVLKRKHTVYNGDRNPHARPVRCIETREEFSYIRGMIKEFKEKGIKFSESGISAVLNGYQKSHRGFTFERVL